MRTLFLLAAALPLAAQSPVQVTQPEAEFPEPFSRLVGLRELSDGRVVIADALEQTVARIDFRTGDLTLIGRQGNGPGEFGAPGALYALAGDSTLMFDFANARGLVITPGASISSNSVSFAGGESAFLILPRGLDARGRFYGTVPLSFQGGGPIEMPDSQPVIRWSPGGATDTLFQLPMATQGNFTVRVGAGGAASFGGGRRQAFTASDMWVVTPEGRIAVVRADPYRVEWVAEGGRRQPGPTVAYRPVRVTDRDKEEWADAQTGNQMMMRTNAGTRTMRSSRPDLDQVDFPEFKPAFERVLAAPNGEIWVRVSRPAGTNRQLYDVFDAQGRRVRQVELGPDRQLIGFGNGTLYAARVDEDDLLWLERYRM